MTATIRALCLVLAVLPALADDHSCPTERPYPRGESACDSCEADDLLRRYRLGELSETRASAVFDHRIKVAVFCDANRAVDADDVFARVDGTDAEFLSLLGRSLNRSDGRRSGRPLVLEVVVGICDTDDGVDDCAMNRLCYSKGWRGCDVSTGIA